MQSEEYHYRHGRGRNVSCDNWECENYRKKIGRVRGSWSDSITCPICHQEGYVHHYTCTVSKGGIMNCNCHLHIRVCYCKLCLPKWYNRKK